MEQSLDEATKNLNTYISNLNYSDKYTGNLTLETVYKLAKPTLITIGSEYSLSNFRLPEEMGVNSIVLFADSLINGKSQEVAIKIFIQPKKFNRIMSRIRKLVSYNEISPTIIYDNIIDIGNKYIDLIIIMSLKVIPFTSFIWTSPTQMKRAVVSLIEKTMKLHTLGIIHNDLKYENFGLDQNGIVYLYDFDNCSEVENDSCFTYLSSSVCLPPPFLRLEYIRLGLRNRIIDLFSILSIILGNIFDITLWQFSCEEYLKKTEALSNFNRENILYSIHYNMTKKFTDYVEQKSSYWYSLTNFAHLIFLKSKITKPRTFLRKAFKLIAIMKTNIEN